MYITIILDQADSRNNRVEVFERNGNFLTKFGTHGSGPGQMDRPSGVCISPEGHIIVYVNFHSFLKDDLPINIFFKYYYFRVDFGNNRVHIF